MRPQILERKLHKIPPDEGLYKTYNTFQLCEHASIAVEDGKKYDHQLAIVASLIPMSFELTYPTRPRYMYDFTVWNAFNDSYWAPHRPTLLDTSQMSKTYDAMVECNTCADC